LLSLLLAIILGLTAEELAAVVLFDTYTNSNIATDVVVKDTLDVDEIDPLPLRGGNVLLVVNTSVSNDGGDTMLARGLLAVDLNDHYTMRDGTHGMELVKAQAHGETLIEAQRNVMVALVSEHSVKATRKDKTGTTHDGRTITQSTWSQRMWLTHYVMKDDVVEGVHLVSLAGYADIR
jgi:hypothetical protein